MTKVVVLGTGTMGAGITRLLDRSETSAVNFSFRNFKSISDENLVALSEADFLLECVTENLEIKKSVLRSCSLKNPEAVIASCTSSLSINELQSSVDRPSRFLGVHFMNPPTLISVVELIKGDKTSIETVVKTKLWLESLKRQVLEVPDSPGFVLNAILFSMLNRAAYLMVSGELDSESIDLMMTGVCGHKLGPLATLDLIGLDVSLRILSNLYLTDPKMNLPPAPVIQQLVGKGFLGKKTKQGFYKY